MRPDPTPDDPVRIKGGINFLLIGLVLAAILMSATVRLGTVTVLEREFAVENVVRDLMMIAITVVVRPDVEGRPRGERLHLGTDQGRPSCLPESS